MPGKAGAGGRHFDPCQLSCRGRSLAVWQAHLSSQTVYLGQIASGRPLPHNFHSSVSKNSSSQISPTLSAFAEGGAHTGTRPEYTYPSSSHSWCPAGKEGTPPPKRSFQVRERGTGAWGNHGFAHRADARLMWSPTPVLVQCCHIYRGKGIFAVRHKGDSG